MTGAGAKFLLLHCPDPNSTTSSIGADPLRTTTTRSSSSSNNNNIASNPISPATEEAVRQFFAEVYESWVKTVMNPFYTVNMEVKSPVFRQRVAAAGRKYL
jgi:hypothetical protein